MSASTELLPLRDLGERELGAWRELAAAAAEPNPFYEPEYAIPLARGTDQFDDTALLVCRDATGWAACLPVRAMSRWHRVPLPSLSSWRAHVLYGLLGTPLVRQDAIEDGAHALVGGLLDARRSWFSGLEWLAEGGPVLGALEAALADRGARVLRFERFQRAFVRRRSQGGYAEETLSAKHRRELRRQRRKLGEELGSDVELVDRSADPAAVDELIALEARSALSGNGTPLASDRAHATFFREASRGFAEQGRLQLLALQAGETTLALKCNVQAGDGCFMLKIAYDETYHRFSPGIQLEIEMLNLFQEWPKLIWMDSCADPNNAMINRLWPDRRTIVSLAVSTPGPSGLIAEAPLRAVRRLRNRNPEGTP